MVSREQRAALKRGPLGGIFSQMRYWKRRLRGEPLNGEYEWNLPALTVEALLPLASGSLDPARLLYSLALGYLDQDSDKETYGATCRALACLRSADALHFESPERTRLYSALAYARLGQTERACTLAETLLPAELTDKENALRQQILQGKVTLSISPAISPDTASETVSEARRRVAAEAPARVLALGEGGAQSASWLPDCAYFCASKEVNGLDAQDVARLFLTFDVGLASEADAQAAARAGVQCERWIIVAWNVG